MQETGRLFDDGADEVERSCRTCSHAAKRHGTHARGTYPLVCLLMACPVTYRYGDGGGTRRYGWPCGVGIDGAGPFPRGWEQDDQL